jgi:acetyltransferase-like isoleucine patch superfamily enzyme
MTEKEKMLSGLEYDDTDKALLEKLVETRNIMSRFNALPASEVGEQQRILRSILGSCGKQFQINQPLHIDYGENIYIGENFYANFGLTVLDEAPVRIGDNALIGPNCSIYTACHPLEVEKRTAHIEWAEPVTIGDNVWIGGNVTICPGVTIGDGSVIGAGSVVTKDIPPYSLAVGNPARVIRELR